MNSMLDLLATAASAADSDGVVGEIQKTFKVYWPLFISQCVSFLIVAFLLKKFAFGPILGMLEQRRTRIAEGEEKLKRIEKQLAESEQTTAAAIAKANEDATRLINEARESATLFTEQKSQEAIAQAQLILSKAEAAAKAERDQLVSEIKREFGRLVASTTSQVTGKVLNDDDHRRINEEALARVEG